MLEPRGGGGGRCGRQGRVRVRDDRGGARQRKKRREHKARRTRAARRRWRAGQQKQAAASTHPSRPDKGRRVADGSLSACTERRSARVGLECGCRQVLERRACKVTACCAPVVRSPAPQSKNGAEPRTWVRGEPNRVARRSSPPPFSPTDGLPLQAPSSPPLPPGRLPLQSTPPRPRDARPYARRSHVGRRAGPRGGRTRALSSGGRSDRRRRRSTNDDAPCADGCRRRRVDTAAGSFRPSCRARASVYGTDAVRSLLPPAIPAVAAAVRARD